MYFAKLACATALLLVAIVGASCLRNGFAIGNALFVELHGNLVEVLQTPFEGTQVEFALSVHENLAQFLALLYFPRGVFLTHTSEGCHHLLGVGLVDGTDGACKLGVGIFDEVETMVAILAVEGIARAHVLEFDGTADIACHELFHLLTISTCTDKQLGHTFARTAVGVGQVVAFVEHTAHHLKILYFTNMGLYSCLKEIDAGGAVLAGNNFLATRIMHLGHFVHEGNHVAKELHQSAYAHVLACTYAEYGEDAAGHHTFANTFAHLVLGQLLGLKEFLHQLLIVLGSGFNEGLVHLLCLIQFLGRDILNSGLAAFGTPNEFLHQDNVNEGIEVGTCLHGVLYGHHFRAIDCLQLLKHHVIVALLVVQLVYQEDDRLAQFLGVAEMVLRTYFGAKLSVEQEHSGIGHVERGEGCAHEVIGTRAVNDVEFLAVPFGVEHGREHGITVILLYGEIVGHGIFLRDTTSFLNQTTLKEK